MGVSRDTFYRYKAAVESGGVEAPIDQDRRQPNLKNRVDEATETAIVSYALEYPAYGQVRVSNELRKQGIFISASSVRSYLDAPRLSQLQKPLNRPKPIGFVNVFIAPFYRSFIKTERTASRPYEWMQHYNNEGTH